MRPPAVAGRFYPNDGDALKETISDCFLSPLGSGLPGECIGSRRIRGVLVPHAGYMVSGGAASNIYRRLAEDGRPDSYVIIGPDHHGMSPQNTFCSEDYVTPMGVCKTHESICKRLAGFIPDFPDAQAYEHSIEVQVPFIQFIDPDAKIVPVLMSDQSPEAAKDLAMALRSACEGFDVVFIASSDMSHYIPKDEAERLDLMVLDRVREMDWEGVYGTVRGNRISMCGYGPLATVMMLCEGCSPEDVGHTDSFDSLGLDRDSVVGYGTAIFTSNP